MLAFVASRQAQILGRRLLRLLDESVEQNHSSSFVADSDPIFNRQR
jgi:hypothetical protein